MARISRAHEVAFAQAQKIVFSHQSQHEFVINRQALPPQFMRDLFVAVCYLLKVIPQLYMWVLCPGAPKQVIVATFGQVN